MTRGGGRQHRPHAARHPGAAPATRTTLPQAWVLELSSFQLDGVQRLRAHGGHGAQHHPGPPGLARQHGTPMPRPRPASSASRRCMVLNREDPAVMAMLPAAGARRRAAKAPASARTSPLAATCRSARATSAWKLSTAWPGWCARTRRRDRASRARPQDARAAHPAPDARRCPAHSRPPQRHQRPGGAGPGPGRGLPAGAHALRPARIPGRAAPRGARGHGATTWSISTTARAPTWAPPWPPCTGLGAERRTGGDSGWRRQGAGLRAAGRARGALCACRGADRARCAR